MSEPSTKICFVVMGFGKKTDYESGRTLDLDATYEAIIQPAVEANGLRCIRANEILHSGIIDVKMYEMLLRADLVIADISTGNVNAVYELGVRHALRPNSTIIMKEAAGQLYFDLDHVNTFEYEHMGEDIGHREAKRANEALSALISSSMEDASPDSPVYTFIPKLKEPYMSDDEYQELLDEAEQIEERFSALLDEAEEATKNSNHVEATKVFQRIVEMSPKNPYLIQQLALHTYKSKEPSPWLALNKASTIIEQLSPESSNDPETLGISGAIYKNMWHLNNDMETLNKAIESYQRGFDLRRDYYNGENAATCLEIRSKIQEDSDNALFDRMSAKKIREAIIEELSELVGSEKLSDRTDKIWVFATLANCYFSLGDSEKGEAYERRFFEEIPAQWQVDTYRSGKNVALESM
ncbi:MAG TPA: hypothetical protein DD827_04480 [Gammaproteobacteria bacterium]|nr:hypothetical protein [Gammaproteobacteria bacterium]